MDKKSIIKNNKVLEGIILSIFSLMLINQSFALQNKGSWPWILSPAVFPLFISLTLFILSVVLILNGIKSNNDDDSKVENWKNVIFILILSLGYLTILPIIHFVLSTIIYLVLFLLCLGERKWWLIVLISLITPIFINFTFGSLLEVLLP